MRVVAGSGSRFETEAQGNVEMAYSIGSCLFPEHALSTAEICLIPY